MRKPEHEKKVKARMGSPLTSHSNLTLHSVGSAKKLFAIKCPECGSESIYKSGLRYVPVGTPIQRFLCRICGYRFSFRPKNSKTSQLTKNCEYALPGSNPGAKNLQALTALKEIERTTTAEAGANGAVKTQLIDFAWHLKREGFAISTITTYSSMLRKLAKLKADLLNPESVKDALAVHDLKPNTKACMIGAYTSFAKYSKLTWKPPKYQWQTIIPFIPMETEIDNLIAGCSKQISSILQTLKETAMRIGEACRLKWININTENRTIILNDPEKGSNPRIFKVSNKLMGMLQFLPQKHEKVFGKSSKQNKTWIFKLQRKRLARKLGNSRLLNITFHTLRHWKASNYSAIETSKAQ